MLAFILRLLPPIGPLRDLKFKVPDAQVERLFEDSFSRASNQYREKLDGVAARNLILTDENYDVWTITPAGKYFLDDDTQAFWLHKLAEKKLATVTPLIRMELVRIFSRLKRPDEDQMDAKA